MSKNPNLSKKSQSATKFPSPNVLGFTNKKFSSGNGLEISFGGKQKDHYRGAGVRILNKPSHQIASVGGLVRNKGANVISGNKKMLFKKSNNQIGKAPAYKIVTQTPTKHQLLSKKGNSSMWDGLSPLSTYSSTTYSPEEMSKVVDEILKKFLNDDIDYEKTSTYLFGGKQFSPFGDSDFRINIFSPGPMSNSQTTCEVEICKMSGHSFGFGRIQNEIIKALLNQNAITKNQGPELGIIDAKEGGFRFNPLPVNMDDSISDFTSDSEYIPEMTTKLAQNLISNAVDFDSYRDDLRYSVHHLRDILGNKKNIEVFRNISLKGIKKLMNFADQCFDSWVVKLLLESINILIPNKCKPSPGLSSDLIKLQKKWSKPVICKVDDSEFKFPPSHQIRKLCDEILTEL